MPGDTPLAIRFGPYLKEIDKLVTEQKRQGYPSNRCYVVRMLVGEALALREGFAVRKRPKKQPSKPKPGPQ